MADIFRERQRTIQTVILVCALALIIKAAQIQLVDDSFRKRADATTIEKLTVYPPRGLVYDRNSELIVNNNAVYDLLVTYNQIDPDMDTSKFCRLLNITQDDFRSLLDKNWRSGQFSRSVPFVFLKKISTTTYARLQECLYEFPGFFVQVRNIRGYPFKVGAHVLGYINEVDPKDIENGGGVYAPGDYIGAGGLESEYEERLRGKKGYTFLLKDNLGRIVGSYEEGALDTLPVNGDDLISSIDIRLQKYGERLMAGKTGSIVAIEPSTGEILSMVSMPTYDPNELTMTKDRGPVFNRLLTDPLKPFFDRTVMAKYPPGSIFKTLVTLIGLQEGTMTPQTGAICNGGYFYAGRLYKCHGHSPVRNTVDALAYSCNAFYFGEFRDVVDKFGFSKPQQGLDMFVDYCHQFGLGRQLGVDYPNENAGNIPTSGYYDAIYPRELGSWRSPTIMSVGIGQGELQLTTLQMANLAACIANRGHWFPPHLAKGFRTGGPIPQNFRNAQKVNIDSRHFDLVVEGMAECVNRGTARSCAIPTIQVCGKTGTSQNPHGEDHSVFFAFAPKENPRIAIAVYVENAGWGSSYAAPIASLMIERYINDTIADNRRYLEERMFNSNLTDRYLANLLKAEIRVQKKTVPPTAPPADSPIEKSPATTSLSADGRRRK
ncbi:MAG: penicillin-binding protein 2 [Bacteroidetes bacterium]|nr:MAG: penicillin-binding protein 2 [Bacteroidota bacterium]